MVQLTPYIALKRQHLQSLHIQYYTSPKHDQHARDKERDLTVFTCNHMRCLGVFAVAYVVEGQDYKRGHFACFSTDLCSLFSYFKPRRFSCYDCNSVTMCFLYLPLRFHVICFHHLLFESPFKR